jgi:predicted ester cyclase
LTDIAAGLVRQFFAVVWNKGDIANGRELFDAGFRHHDLVTDAEADLSGYFMSISQIRRRLTSIELTLHELIAEDGRVASRWTATGQYLLSGRNVAIRVDGMSIDHIRNERIIENWTVWDLYGLNSQAPGFLQ